MEILVHADGDEAGAAIAGLVLKRTGARPWRTVDARAGIHEESLLDDLGSGVVGQRRLAAGRLMLAPVVPSPDDEPGQA